MQVVVIFYAEQVAQLNFKRLKKIAKKDQTLT